MAVTIVSFRWLEILEKEFDKNFVDLDLLIGDLDTEEPDFVYSARQKLAGLSSCFAQLTHKAQTIFQNSAKVEAELVDLRTELVNSKTRQEILEEDSRSLVLQLHSLQLDRLPSNQNPEQYKEKIETALKLSPSKSAYSEEITFRNNSEIKKLKNELLQYQSENIILRNSILALHSEVYGARLAAKYLDKELAGRIQQLQLLGKEMRTDVRDKLWRQLESEILLHRHKTVIRACRNRTNHEFVPTDSRILNFNHSDERYLKNDYMIRRTNSLDGFANRRKDIDFLKKSDLHPKNTSFDGLNQHTPKHLVQNNGNYFMEESNEDSESMKTNGENGVDIDSNGSPLNEPSRNNSSETYDKDVCIKEDNESISAEKNIEEVRKTDENSEKRELKLKVLDKKKSNSTDGEEFLCMVGEKRSVIVKRQPGQGLGISITGGREHGVPILISELEIGGPAYECKNLFVGDAILKVNDISLETASHFEAVKILTNLETNNVKLIVQFIAVDTDEENSLSEDLYGYRYRFFDTEVMDSSDALGLHPLHSKSAHTPTAPRTPDYARSERQSLNRSQSKQSFEIYNVSNHVDEVFVPENQSVSGIELLEKKNSPNLIDIDTELPKDDSDKLKIDLFGFRFQTDIRDVANYESESLLDDFLVRKAENIKPEADLIQIEVSDTKPSSKSEKKFEYVDENIFSGIEDHSILDNIIKSFSEDDFSYLDVEKEKNVTSDSGLEVCLSGSDLDGDKVCVEERYRKNSFMNDWVDNTPEKVELKTLQQIFDRSFSSNLSSPRGSTSFDDDILSTEHSDEKSHCANDFKNKTRDMKNAYNLKKAQKFYQKNGEVSDDILKKTFAKQDFLVNQKNEINIGKKMKKSGLDTIKRSKSARKSKENSRKEGKCDKRKNSRDLEGDFSKLNEINKKREVNFKMTDHFEENLIEYNVNNYETDNRIKNYESENTSYLEGETDEIEETRKLSRRYGLKIPGKGVKAETNDVTIANDVKSPEHSVPKVIESHFKHIKSVPESSVKANEKQAKSKAFRCSRYDSFGDPDFGTPV